ncbi:MAG: ABC transporter permease [Gemmatimonadota bacterium]
MNGESAQRIRSLVRKEMRQLLRDPRARPILFVAPVIQLVLFGYAVNTDVRHTSTFLVDHDRTAESRALRDAFTASGYFDLVGESLRPSDLVAELDRGRAVVGLQIPAGFAAAVARGDEASVQVLVDGSDSNTATIAQGYANLITRRFLLARREAAQGGPARATGLDLRARAWFNPDLESRVYNVPAIVGVLLMLICLLLTSLSVVREREIGTLDQLLVSPVRPAELMIGKTIPVTLIGLVDLVLITGVAHLWFHIPFRGSPGALFLAALLYIVAGLSFGLIISSVSRTQQEAFMSMFLFLMPTIILSGFLYPIASMPQVFQWVTYLNPVRYFLEIVRGIFLKGNGLADLWPQYAAVSAIAAAGLGVATNRFRRDTA